MGHAILWNGHGPRPWITDRFFGPVTPHSATRFSLICLGLAVCELVGLPWLIGLDTATYRWVQTLRSCRADSLATFLKQAPLVGLLLLGSLPLVALAVRRQWAEAWRAGWVTGGGVFLCELLKTGLERARPSVLTPSLVGNSFPSGHISTALLISGVFIFLGQRSGWNAWLRHSSTGLCAALSALIIWQRVYLGHHWLLDVSCTVLLSAAWLSFGLSRPARLPVSRSGLVWGLGLLVCYSTFLLFPHTRLTLPSARAVENAALVHISFGRPTQHLSFAGAWGARDREPAGPIIWMKRGEAGLTFSLPRPDIYLLRFAARPFVHTRTETCYPLTVLINGHVVGRQLLYRGWREYELWLKPDWVVAGKNEVRFRVGPDFPPAGPERQTVALRSLRIAPP